jgi:hypothetical protein
MGCLCPVMSEDKPLDTEDAIERNLGTQPLDAVLQDLQLDNHAVVAAFPAGLTHKAMQRARKGRRLTPKMKVRITETLNKLLRDKGETRKYGVGELFNY